MQIGERLRQLREDKQVSQGFIAAKTGLIRAYVSRVENGHSTPAIGTLQKFARALEVPMHELFHEGDKPPKPLRLGGSKRRAPKEDLKELDKFRHLMLNMKARDQKLILMLAGNFVKDGESKSSR
jgi:transcriptional regulator with XRE-family HTH domain